MRIPILVVISLLSLTAISQHPFLSRFTANTIDSGIYLEWTLTAGNTCQGITIERAATGEAFHEIGHIEGICGSVDKAEDFSFTDDEPLIGIENRYRLLLGISGYTDEISLIYHDFDGSGFEFLHDRSEATVSVLSNSNTNTEREISIFSSSGALIRSLSMSGDSHEESISDLSIGAYTLIVLEDDKVVYTARFVKSD